MKTFFLLEEQSMEYFLRGLIPRIFSTWKEEVDYFLRSHQGKNDLQNSIKPFLNAIKTSSNIKVVIIHDQDQDDCVKLKSKLRSLCNNNSAVVMIRIACQELESWYIGDPISLSKIYPEYGRLSRTSRFRQTPDSIVKPSSQIMSKIKTFSKTTTAKIMGQEINIDTNRSTSFQQLISGLKKITGPS